MCGMIDIFFESFMHEASNTFMYMTSVLCVVCVYIFIQSPY